MIVAKEHETLSEAQSGALYAPPTPVFAITESRETTHNMSFRPKGVDWACSLRKNKNTFESTKSCIVCTPNTRFHNKGITRNLP